MKKFLVLASGLLLGISIHASNPLPSPKSEKLQPIDKIVAIANKAIITQSDVQRATQSTIKQFKQLGVSIPPKAILHKKILDTLILQKLQLELAKSNNITASKQQVNDAIKHIAQQNHLTVEQLEQKLEVEGISVPAFKEQISQQIIIRTLQQEVIRSKLKLDDEALASFKQKHAKDNAITQYRVQDYLIPLANDASNADEKAAKKLAVTIARQLKGKQTLTNNAVVVNNLGWKPLSDLPDLFSTHLVKMAAGSVTQPIKAGNGYHVLRLEGKKKQSQTLTDAQAKQLMFQQQAQKILKEWLDQLRSQAYVKVYD